MPGGWRREPHDEQEDNLDRPAAFAGAEPGLSPDQLTAVRSVIEPRLDTTAFPVAFACLYGDEAAKEVGYEALGLPPFAGYAVALDDARTAAETPEETLLGLL